MRPWFRPKVRGIGWTPCSWEGWVATGLLIAAILGSTHFLGHTWQAVAVAVAAGVAYLITILLTRGAPDRSNRR